MEYGANNTLRFINFVGVIYLEGFIIEVVPKVALSAEDNRKALISMLHHARYLSVDFYDRIASGMRQDHLLDALLAAYVHRLQDELQRGSYKGYIEHVENRGMLRGKVLVTEHLRMNAFTPSRVVCQFDEHSDNNRLNQILKFALRIAQRRVSDRLYMQIERCLALMSDVEDRLITRDDFDRLVWNRQNERFRDVVLFAKLIIDKVSIHHIGDRHQSFSFLFEMNMLFEAYIGAALMEIAGPANVHSQHTEKKLLLNKKTNRMNIQLKPDFVIGDSEMILDTKWKSAVYNGRLAYQQSDLYQMYAYVTAYEKATRCILVYPYQEEFEAPVWQVIDTNKSIEMAWVRLHDYEATKEDLWRILNYAP
ncbi:5-methylcytosine restriction system specificity protein McrC [Paenibacillus sp. CCS19]|uniref:McrC family protein n=1 Tax=Paenibacillus sp. CCS19 TaxID=3158387 RepID=UPI00295EA350|nr:ATP-dependent helicase [Paenibacillus cellulosilyticus]